MLWFDYNVWYIINNLHVFFPNDTYPSLPSKFGAFLSWVKGAVRIQITFMAVRRLMEAAVLELATDPSHKFLASITTLLELVKLNVFFSLLPFHLQPRQLCLPKKDIDSI
jgi:hypothetical protein